MGYIYRHIRIDKNEPFYIGLGMDSDGFYKRAFDFKQRNKIWKSIKSRSEIRVDIIFDDIETVEEAFLKEKEFISIYGRIALNNGTLCNLTDGGDGIFGYRHTEETKIKISKAGTGRKATEETLERMKKAHAGRIISDEIRLKAWVANKGSKKSEETKLKQSLATKGRKKPDGVMKALQEKAAKFNTGRKQPREVVEKRLITRNSWTEERKIQFSKITSKNSKGRRHTEQTLAKMRLVQAKPPMHDITKKKLSDIHKNLSQEKRDRQNAGRHSTHVSAFDVGTNNKVGDFKSLGVCARTLNISASTILRNINGISKNPLRYYFVVIKKT